MLEYKLTGNIHDDIDTVFDAVEYVEGLVNGLAMEEIAQNNENHRRMPIYLEMVSVQQAMHKAAGHSERMRREEERYMYGTLAGRKDM